MSKLFSFFGVFAFLIIAMSCNQKAPTRIVSQQTVKTEILGLRICDKTDVTKVEKALEGAIGDKVIVDSQRTQNGRIIRAVPLSLTFSYGGNSWTYVDMSLDGEDRLTTINLTASYENLENAKRQYEQVVPIFEKKYGKGNARPEGQLTFWTDDINSVGVYYQESASINGNNRSFCTLYYVNIALSDSLDALNKSDI